MHCVISACAGSERPVKGFGLSSPNEIGLILIHGIRGTVHYFRWDNAPQDIHKDVICRQRYEKLREGKERWAAQVFYINRFMQPRGIEYEYSGLRQM